MKNKASVLLLTAAGLLALGILLKRHHDAQAAAAAAPADPMSWMTEWGKNR